MAAVKAMMALAALLRAMSAARPRSALGAIALALDETDWLPAVARPA